MGLAFGCGRCGGIARTAFEAPVTAAVGSRQPGPARRRVAREAERRFGRRSRCSRPADPTLDAQEAGRNGPPVPPAEVAATSRASRPRMSEGALPELRQCQEGLAPGPNPVPQVRSRVATDRRRRRRGGPSRFEPCRAVLRLRDQARERGTATGRRRWLPGCGPKRLTHRTSASAESSAARSWTPVKKSSFESDSRTSMSQHVSRTCSISSSRSATRPPPSSAQKQTPGMAAATASSRSTSRGSPTNSRQDAITPCCDRLADG